jgi:hypothetical protein
MTDELWKVTNVSDTQMFLPGQGAVSAKKVTFATVTGTTSSVNIPDTDFNAESVAAAVHASATNIIEVQALKGPSITGAVEPSLYDPAMYPNG